MMFWYGPGFTGWGYALMAIAMVVFWAVLVIAGVALVRRLARNATRGPGPSGPERTLAERFARGEIDEDEYQQRLAVLRETGTIGRP